MEIPSGVLSQLNKIEEDFSAAEDELLKHQTKLFTPLYEKRDPLIRQVPKFWATVFEESDDLSELIGVEDQALLSHLVEVKVRRGENPKDFTITMEFAKDNGFVENDHLVLEKSFKSSTEHEGHELSSTPVDIKWIEGRDLTKDSSGRPSFFTFFAWTGNEKDVFGEGEEVALVIAESMYPDALKIWTDAQEIDSDEGSVDIDSEEDAEEDDEPAAKKQKKS